MEQTIDITHFVLKTNVLGPYVRSALWVRGCCFDCEGCLAYDMNRRAPDLRSISALAEMFAACEDTEGITISGGEAFLQAGALADMLSTIKEKRNYGVVIYTGFTLEELKERRDSNTERLLGMTDILIDGRYDKNADDGKAYRGSANQRIIQLSQRYADIFESYYSPEKKRNIEINVDGKNVYLVGVPSAHGLETWKDLQRRAECNGNRI